ncbi:IS66 family transposase zinc-finger binding domain-containing protein [Mameliella alba]|uniref:IS66 family transposase zinc-finger binding domain-containing protein n=1 Tax=Mameliella alba TaxID=561184 RepID=UPI001E3AA2AB|nr:IS66 family transposase zinc-finger binding domain-containing protein [Mameliella alba]
MDFAMLDAFKSLPEDPDELRAVSEQMAQNIQSQAYQIEKLKAELAGHRKALFGAKSERLDQLALDLPEDDEIAQAAEDQYAEQWRDDEETPAKAPAKRQHSRKPFPDHLDREDEILSPGEACHDCGDALRQVGEDVTEELDYIPGHFVVRRFIRPRMACTCCEAFAQAPLPSRPIERAWP